MKWLKFEDHVINLERVARVVRSVERAKNPQGVVEETVYAEIRMVDGSYTIFADDDAIKVFGYFVDLEGVDSLDVSPCKTG